MPILLHQVDPNRPSESWYNTPTSCKTRSRDPLVFDSREAAEIVASIPGYGLCPRCWPPSKPNHHCHEPDHPDRRC